MGLIEKTVKPQIQSLIRIKDNLDERYDYLRLDKNERLLPFTDSQLADFKHRITSEGISGYAELGSVYRKLAQYLGVKEEQLLLASGSDLAIKSVYEVCVGPGDHIVLHAPCYAMYKVYARMFGAEATLVPVDAANWTADTAAMLSAVNSRTKFMALENPNGFVGTGIALDTVEHCCVELAKHDVILLVDEAYYYVQHSSSKLVELTRKYGNLIVSQTFSKSHGLAGARMGYLMGSAKLIEFINRVRPMHEITSLTALAVEWILEHPEMLVDFQEENLRSKRYLKKELAGMGIEVRDTEANFILLYLPNEGKTKDIAGRLKEHRILIRRPFEEPYLKGWIRVCAGSVADSKKFIQTLKTILA